MRRRICAVASLSIAAFFQFSGVASAETNSLWSGLLQGISSNNIDQVKCILKVDAALVNATNDYSDPPLVLAARQKNLELINVLLDAGADVNKSGPQWGHADALCTILNPILYYPWFRRGYNSPSTNDFAFRYAIARVLLAHGALIFSRIPSSSLISEAGRLHQDDLVDFLLLEGGTNITDEGGNTPIHIAALWARTNVIKTLAQRKCNLEATNFLDLTPLQAVSRLPRQEEGAYSRADLEKWSWAFDHRPGFDADGPRFRHQTANLLISLGAKLDVFSAIALGWTNTVRDLLSKNPRLSRFQNGVGETPLHWASYFGDIDSARMLLQAGSDVNSTNWQGLGPLDLAAAKAQNEVAKLLVADHAIVNRPYGVKTPLHWAAELGNTPLLDFLLKSGAEPNAEDEHQQAPIDLAAKGSHDPEVERLFASHARFRDGTNITTPLHWAAANDNTNLIALLLKHGANIESRNEQGKTPLLVAHDHDNFSALEFLLALGADINAKDTNGNTALHLRAAAQSDLIPPQMRSMMEFLLAHGADVNARNYSGETPLHRVAAGKGFYTRDPAKESEAWIQPLVNHHANLEARDRNGCTPLALATQNYNRPIIEALVKHGAQLNAQDKSGATIIEWALKRGNQTEEEVSLTRWLVEHGAGVAIADNSGTTPLHVAVTGESYLPDTGRMAQIVPLFLKCGANVNAVDSEGRAPLHLACNKYACDGSNGTLWGEDSVLPGDFETFKVYWVSGVEGDGYVPKILLTNGALANVRDHAGNTPLHYAAEAVRIGTVKALLDHHANRLVRNKNGQTPLDLAYEQAGGFQIVPLLQPTNVSGEIGDAAYRNDLKMAKAFLKDDPHNANASWLWGSTPLDWACNEGHLEMVKLLLANGAQVNPSHDDRGDVGRMVEFNRIMNYFAGNGIAWTNSDASGGQTNCGIPPPSLSASPLELAVANHHFEIAGLLIKHGAKVDLASAASLGMTRVIQCAVRVQPQRINDYSIRGSWHFEPIVKRGFLWNPAATVQSGSLLHFAVLGKQPNTVKYLLEAGANRSMLDDEGRTPIQLAMEMKLSDIVTLFKSIPSKKEALEK